MSAIVEIKVPVARTEEIIRLVWDVEKRLDTVVAIGVATRCGEHGEEVIVAPILEADGIQAGTREDEYRFGPDCSTNRRACQGDCKRMTNTLHRFGDAESFRDDYIVFAIPSKSNKDPNALPKLHRFLEIAMEYKPVNLGETRHGGALRSSKNLGPLAHWKRDMKPDFQAVIKGLTVPTTCAAVFDNPAAAEQFVKRIKEEIWG
jgi:hypothetical protein